MPRYFFNVRSEDRFVRDAEGGEYANMEAAKVEAERSAREMLADALIKGEEVDGNRFEVIDESGAVIFTYPFRNAMKLP